MITRALTTDSGLTLVVKGREHTATWDDLAAGKVGGPFRTFTEHAPKRDRAVRAKLRRAAAGFQTGIMAGAFATAVLKSR